jgi:hypothetical protein
VRNFSLSLNIYKDINVIFLKKFKLIFILQVGFGQDFKSCKVISIPYLNSIFSLRVSPEPDPNPNEKKLISIRVNLG